MSDDDPDPLWWRLLRLPYDAVQDYVEDDGPTLAASLSFYALLSLAPMLLVVTELAGWWLGTDAAISQIRGWLAELVTGDALDALNTLLDQLAEQKIIRSSGFFGWLGGLSTLFVATTLVAQLQRGLNRIWRVRPNPERQGVVIFLVKRGISLAIVLVTVVAVLASTIVSGSVDTVLKWASGLVPSAAESFAYDLGGGVVTWVVLTLIFTTGFQVLPDVRIRWVDALAGGAFTVLLVEVGSGLLGWYFGVAAVGSAWGASGAVAVLLIWVYYTSNILLLGVELTRCWALCFGGGMEPGRFAVGVR